MKKEIWSRSVTLKEVSIEEVISAFFKGREDYFDSVEEVVDCAEIYLDNEIQEMTEEEKEAVINGIKEKFEVIHKASINDEIEKLKNREHIIQWIDHIIYDDYYGNKNVDMGEPGYILTSEEILDLILENGNK